MLRQVASIRFETALDRSAALRELRQERTLAIMPSLLDNSPYAVAECIEHGVPFIATHTGGIPELVADDDRARVLCRPAPDDVAAALQATEEALSVAEPLQAWETLAGALVTRGTLRFFSDRPEEGIALLPCFHNYFLIPARFLNSSTGMRLNLPTCFLPR